MHFAAPLRLALLRSAPLLAVALIAVSAASADVITPVAQTRTLRATSSAADAATSGADADSSAALDFGLFDDAVAAQVSLSGALGTGTAIQMSEMTPVSIHADGSHSANGEGYEDESYGDGSGRSRFDFTFLLSQSCDYQLTGWIENYDNGNTFLDLTGPGGSVHSLAPNFNSTCPSPSRERSPRERTRSSWRRRAARTAICSSTTTRPARSTSI